MENRIKDILKTEAEDQEITVEGWIRTKRDSKNLCFFELSDGSSLKNLQIIIDKEKYDLSKEIDRLSTGASAVITGTLVKSPGKNQSVELQGQSIEVIGEASPETYPLQKKRHSFEFLREIAHLRPRTNTFAAITRVRSTLSFAVHKFFQENDFVYVHTPIISASDAEGAGEMFQITTLPMDNVPKIDGEVDYTKDFFGKPANLTVSGQLEGEIYATALKDIYTFGPTFRAENSNTSRHLAEFWMIEPEMAFCNLDGNIEVAEKFLKYILQYVLDNSSEDMNFFNSFVQKGIIDDIKHVINSPFTHLTYTEAVEILISSATKFEFPVEWGHDLQSEHERYLTEEIYNGPVILTDYPKDIKAFYMKLNEDGKTVRAMDILVPRLGEIIGGSERESDLEKLKTRLDEQDLNHQDYWWYLELRQYGTVPHAGFGLGFERLIQYVTGMQNIRDVIPFPRTVGSAEF
ncbi:MAG: asparagine--tRNA ligase [Spirochaetia bacterium]|jgi:asparaginyl-tRNA synthetase|nr:asparagine--tRNA ligase [Spirochaetia bacterium]